MKHLSILLAFLMVFSSPVAAQDLIKGLAAIDTKDYKIALKEMRPLAEEGNSVAQYNLGRMYRKGRGVLQDYSESVKWFKLAAQQADGHAQNMLGIMYSQGQGVLQDTMVAHMWYNIGAANGSENGGTNRDYIATKMTSEDIAKAHSMARKCMESGYTECGY